VGLPRRPKRLLDWREEVGLSDQARQCPDQLSGGPRQRVAIARGMPGQPKVVLADAPTANLDSLTAANILDLVEEINSRTRCTFIFATHDPALMSRAHRCVQMHDGALIPQTHLE